MGNARAWQDNDGALRGAELVNLAEWVRLQCGATPRVYRVLTTRPRRYSQCAGLRKARYSRAASTDSGAPSMGSHSCTNAAQVWTSFHPGGRALSREELQARFVPAYDRAHAGASGLRRAYTYEGLQAEASKILRRTDENGDGMMDFHEFER